MATTTAMATSAHRGPGVGTEMGLKCPCGQHCPPPQPGQSQVPPRSHNSQGILATRSGMSLDSVVVPMGVGALWGPGGCPISPP